MKKLHNVFMLFLIFLVSFTNVAYADLTVNTNTATQLVAGNMDALTLENPINQRKDTKFYYITRTDECASYFADGRCLHYFAKFASYDYTTDRVKIFENTKFVDDDLVGAGVGPNNKLYYLARGSSGGRNLYEYDIATSINRVVLENSSGKNILVGSDGKVYFGDSTYSTGKLYAVDPQSGTTSLIWSAPGSGYYPTKLKDTVDGIYFQYYDDVMFFRYSTGAVTTVRRLSNIVNYDYFIDASAEGSILYHYYGQVYVINETSYSGPFGSGSFGKYLTSGTRAIPHRLSRNTGMMYMFCGRLSPEYPNFFTNSCQPTVEQNSDVYVKINMRDKSATILNGAYDIPVTYTFDDKAVISYSENYQVLEEYQYIDHYEKTGKPIWNDECECDVPEEVPVYATGQRPVTKTRYLLKIVDDLTGAVLKDRIPVEALGTLSIFGNALSAVQLSAIPHMINDYSQITIVSPSPNQPVSELASVVPTVTVSDPEGGTLSVSYYLDSETAPRDTRIISNTATPQTVSFSALDISALSEGAHSLRFTSGSGSANTASETVSVLVDKSPPAIENVSYNSTETSISVSMTATDAISGLDSSPYRFTIDSEAGAWTTATSSEKNNLLPGTGYSVTLEAKDAVGHIASQVQRMYTKAQIPALSASQAGEDTLELSVSDGNPSATEYQLVANGQYVDASGNLTASPVWIAPVNKRITVKGLTPNTGYALQAKARNQIGEETAFSAAITATTLASPPVNLVVEPAQRSIKVTWPTTAGASYDIEADGVRIDNGTSTTYVHSGLEPETQHSYRVRVRNAGGTGNWSTSITPFTLPYPPAVPSNILTSPQQTEMTVTWDTVARAVSYDVKADGSVTEMTQTSFVHRGLQPLTNHTYQIRARNAGGVSEWSQPVESRTLPYPPSVPANVTAQPAIRNVTVTWDSTEGADAYEIYVDGLRMDNGAATSYVHEGLDPLTGHTYQVRAKNAGGYSAWSQPIHVTTHPEKPLTPTNIISTSDETAINVMWFKPANTDSYEVEIDGQSIVTVLDNSYIHTGLAPESKHSYRIRAKNISGYSDWSAVASMTTLPQHSEEGMSLTNMVAVVTNRFITVSWDTVAVNAQYEIEVDGVLQNIGKDTVYQHAGLKANEFHTYKIRLINNDKPSQWVAILSLSTLPDPPDAPEGLEAVATNTSIELHWKKITGADGYDIEIDGKTVSAGADVTYLHTPLAPGTAHTYRIRAKNITGVTAWSPSLVKSTTSPTYIVNGVKDKTFDLSLLAANVQDFSELTFEVTYNPDQLEVVDLYNYTPNADTASGSIPGSNLMVEYAPGKIVYRVKQNIVPGTSWSGEITGIVFKSKIDGQSSMDVIVK